MNLSQNAKGFLLAFFGILTLSPDSLLIRLIDIDLWTLTFLRSAFMALSLILFSMLFSGRRAFLELIHLDRYAWMIAIVMAVSNIFFVASVQTTSVAHTLIIVGAAPIVAAVLGMVLLKEQINVHGWMTIIIVFIGLIVVVYDDQSSSLLGDFYALLACLLWSGIFILARLSQVKTMVAAICINGLINASWTLPLAQLDTLTQNQWLLAILLGTLVGLALSQITTAPRFIPAAEVAMFMPLETVFGSLLVWWFLDEYPGPVSIIAGVVIILAIIYYSYLQLRSSTRHY